MVRSQVDEAVDIVLDFDAEKNKFTTNQVVLLHESQDYWYPYQTFTEVAFTKYAETAATPIDPTLEGVVLSGNYPYIRCTIPAVGTHEETLNKEKNDVRSDIYNLAGQRLANGQKPSRRHTLTERTAKGLYIINGKKVMVK